MGWAAEFATSIIIDRRLTPGLVEGRSGRRNGLSSIEQRNDFSKFPKRRLIPSVDSKLMRTRRVNFHERKWVRFCER